MEQDHTQQNGTTEETPEAVEAEAPAAETPEAAAVRRP